MDQPFEYFSWFGLTPSLYPDLKQLRAAYLEKSRLFHPDFYTLEHQVNQDQSLELATLNTRAYEVLSKDDTRFLYILKQANHWQDEHAPSPDPEFLMEMMDLNEAIENLSENKSEVQSVKNQLIEWEQLLDKQAHELNEGWKPSLDFNDAGYQKLKQIVIRRKYLLRLKQSFTTFAHP